MDARLEDRDYLAGSYSIADIACFPWVENYHRLGAEIEKFPRLQRWHHAINQRPAVQRGLDVGSDWYRPEASGDKEAHSILFGQTSETITAARNS